MKASLHEVLCFLQDHGGRASVTPMQYVKCRHLSTRRLIIKRQDSDGHVEIRLTPRGRMWQRDKDPAT